MIKEEKFPVLEFDDEIEAIINPSNIASRDGKLSSNKMVITFFQEVIDELLLEEKIIKERDINGENPYTIYKFIDDGTLIVLGRVGASACGMNLDIYNGLGVDKVMCTGGGGVLDSNIKVGQILVVEGAIRDEGFSYQYLKASRIVYNNPKTNEIITDYLDKHNIDYLKGLVWTTDAILRETKERVKLRKKEGAKIVEMEQAACLALSEYRGFDYGALIYGGDDVSKDNWDERLWHSRKGIRYNLVMLCKDLVKLI